MKNIRLISILFLVFMLIGCGGHGYEGEFEISDEFINQYSSGSVVIGPDFVETNGVRRFYEDIFVRKSGANKYLVFKDSDSDIAWRIVDKDTLAPQEIFGVEVLLKRIN